MRCAFPLERRKRRQFQLFISVGDKWEIVGRDRRITSRHGKIPERRRSTHPRRCPRTVRVRQTGRRRVHENRAARRGTRSRQSPGCECGEKVNDDTRPHTSPAGGKVYHGGGGDKTTITRAQRSAKIRADRRSTSRRAR